MRNVGWRLIATALGALALGACGGEKEAAGDETTYIAVTEGTGSGRGDPEVGSTLFVAKGCVICHSVNGVGGKAGPALDFMAEIGGVSPIEFAARMWRGAPAMIELQSVELGYVIDMTGEDLRHLSAFAQDRDAQRNLTMSDVPEEVAAGFLDENFWEVENWEEFLRTGREGLEPEPDAGTGDQ